MWLWGYTSPFSAAHRDLESRHPAVVLSRAKWTNCRPQQFFLFLRPLVHTLTCQLPQIWSMVRFYSSQQFYSLILDILHLKATFPKQNPFLDKHGVLSWEPNQQGGVFLYLPYSSGTCIPKSPRLFNFSNVSSGILPSRSILWESTAKRKYFD